ncbi:hypothetical protein ABIB62_004268 [Mucilaginibacter sp. UYP25]|uniref:hypothetical protein n=1 Tax=unclassified Mucilaginibacter TaxID=2617802 RepID=UPI00339479DC
MDILTKLGISPEIQAFFNPPAGLSFNYGDQQEHYGEGFHTVPSTQDLWVAGSQQASHVIITYSAMEAMAFITLNRHRYPRLEQLSFIAIGNRFYIEQADWIRQNFQGRRFTLVFSKDLIGHITDIKLTAGIKNIAIRIFHSGNEVMVYRDNLLHVFHNEQISLHAFQEVFSIRPRFRTGKPVHSLTFLDQLKHDAER